MIWTCSAHQNDHLIFIFVKDKKVGVEKMTRNRRKMIEQMGDSLLLSKHSIQLSDLMPCQNEINETLFKLPWCGISGHCFVHNVRCNGWDVPYSSQIRTLCVLAHLHTEIRHRAGFHSLDQTELVLEVLGKHRLCK